MYIHSSARQRVSSLQGRPAIAAVEFALILAFVLSPLALGMLVLSRTMIAKEALCNAARKGCRTGILKQYGNSDIFNDAVNVMGDYGYPNGATYVYTQGTPPADGTGNNQGWVTISVTDPNGTALTESLDAPSGSKVTVQVYVPIDWMVSPPANFLPIYWGSGNNNAPALLESDQIVMMKQ